MRHRKQAGTPARVPASALPSSPLRSVADVAAMLGVSTRTVRRLIAGGELVPHRIGRSLRVSEHDLRVYLARCR
jgi:excisionase family DNA binding protein